jgi:hypothetical protein
MFKQTRECDAFITIHKKTLNSYQVRFTRYHNTHCPSC